MTIVIKMYECKSLFTFKQNEVYGVLKQFVRYFSPLILLNKDKDC